MTADWETLRLTAAGNLAGFPRIEAPAGPGLRRASVAICVVDDGGRPSFLVIRRARKGRHAGQWALPGGRVDGGESSVEAALRELSEEAGLHAASTDVVGLLDDFVTVSGFVITPVVVFLGGPATPRPDPYEVQALYLVPVARLLADGLVQWYAEDGRLMMRLRLRPDMQIHPPTGAILWQFREVALRGRSARVNTYHQPRFTHR